MILASSPLMELAKVWKRSSATEGMKPLCSWVTERLLATSRADGLRVVVVEDQAVEVAGEIFDDSGDARVRGQVFAAEGDHIDAALVDEFFADRAGPQIGSARRWQSGGAGANGGAQLLFHAAIEQGIPAHDQVVDAGTLVAEVAVGRPAALGVVLGADDHVHAAVDDPVDLLADDESLDGRVAENGDQQSALAARLVHGMAEVGQIKDGHAEKLEEGVGGGGLAVGEVDGAGDQPPVRLRQAAVGHGAVDDAVVALAGLEQNPAGEEEGIGCGVDARAAGGCARPASR